MDDNIVKAVLERSKGLCENCRANGEHLHHIVSGSGKRKQYENEYSVVLLCQECHTGTNGVHGKNGRELALKFKRGLQDIYYDFGYEEDEIRELMGGKLY